MKTHRTHFFDRFTVSRILRFNSLILTLLIILFASCLFLYFSATQATEVRKANESHLTTVVRLLRDPVLANDRVAIRGIVDKLFRQNEISCFSIHFQDLGPELYFGERGCEESGSGLFVEKIDFGSENGASAGGLPVATVYARFSNELEEKRTFSFWTGVVVLLALVIGGIFWYTLLTTNIIVKRIKMYLTELVENLDSDQQYDSKQLIDHDSGKEILERISSLREKINAYRTRIERQTEVEIFNRIATQVAHDVRSPLAALNTVTSKMFNLPEGERLLVREATKRIQDIVNNLLYLKNKVSGADEADVEIVSGALLRERVQKEASSELLSSILEAIVSEKRTQYRSKLHLQLSLQLNDSFGSFALIHGVEFKRVISNIIDNSVEALEEVKFGNITLDVRADKNEIQLSIEDNGKGIPSEILPQLMKRGRTFGKKGGSGLGLAHAKETVELMGGTIAIASEENVGTKLTIVLPRIDAPKWFADHLELEKSYSVAIVDDDSSIHQIWQGRIRSVFRATEVPNIEHFSTPGNFRAWVSKTEGDILDRYLFLVDYEFVGTEVNGLDLIEELGLLRNSILVTSRYEENSVRERALELGIKIIPKSHAGFVSIILK